MILFSDPMHATPLLRDNDHETTTVSCQRRGDHAVSWWRLWYTTMNDTMNDYDMMHMEQHEKKRFHDIVDENSESATYIKSETLSAIAVIQQHRIDIDHANETSSM